MTETQYYFDVIRVFISELLEKNTDITVFKKSNMVLCSLSIIVTINKEPINTFKVTTSQI